MSALLQIEDLSIAFGRGGRQTPVVQGVNLTLNARETLALVGESGSGKSITALSVPQLLPYPLASHPTGRILVEGESLIGASTATLRRFRGGALGMVFQEPMTSLNPVHTLEKQIGETLRIHQGLSAAAARDRIVELLEMVRLPEASARLGAFPHQLSGGQRQRVMIAMAIANSPRLLIADEPTTALDVTIQAEILELLADLKQRLDMAMLLISHDLNVVRRVADRVAVMQQGRVVEQGEAASVFEQPRSDYTRALIAAEPSGRPRPVANPQTVLEARDLRVWFPRRGGLLKRVVGHLKAVDGIDLAVGAGETLGVVGESGSGKTTLGMALLRLQAATGQIRFEGRDISRLGKGALRPLRRRLQVVFQDPYGSLSPRLSVEQIIGEGLAVHRIGADAAERGALAREALAEVGLDPALAERFPHELSGGQRQRVAVARAIVLKPAVVVLDEPTSALDRSVQTQLVELLRSLQARHGLAYVFISHDLKIVRAMSHRMLVMQSGQVVESGPAERIFTDPQAAYTQRLLAAAL
ncbi:MULTISPECIES: ABC transporter ATP-binding protein [Spiribacter]|jgi:microcin C transport system ATP-binding protein|uniref:ABC transporter ATP-binding protein n=1 Tax=Spiribacter aquaticus TaxID=1935996 RepID=A0A557RJZ6_9GAMM|nr:MULTISPECIES: ABC transporter ATP-binding protein [Spiribacter]AUB78019.1 microcin ABC transporter ATP-binding protein [Spiribacter roseus]KAF0279986.1 microcin ABC transporter ATP-binding protein [Spiribacter roseus]KAF0283639.1 microcin ABC transporter ATP-binding protein [Spiribacter roseus]TVO65488.1 ABC transporter ATP-binding protein [Spiribacter aquaticus]